MKRSWIIVPPALLALPLLAASCASYTARYAPAPAPVVPPVVPSSPGVAQAATPDTGPLRLTVGEAILRSLERNRALAVQRYAPALRELAAETQRAAFDPVVSAQASQSFDRGPASSGGMNTSESTALTFSADQAFAAGTQVGVEAAFGLGDSGTDTTRLGVSVTQPLLAGAGSEANLATLRQAEIDLLLSDYELRGYAEAQVAEVESACWDYALALRRLDIVASSMTLAEQQLAETEERIKVGKLAEIELVAARSETALRKEELINARSAIEAARLRLLRLVDPGEAGDWGRAVELADLPSAPGPAEETAEGHVRQALRMRPELNQARLQLRRGDLDVVASRNGLLPKLDLFLTLGKTGYSDSFLGSIGDLTGGGYDIRFGLTGKLPMVNRAERAASARALLLREQSAEALSNLEQTVQVDVRTAWLETRRLAEQIAATEASRTLQEEKARAETEKFRVGRSTSFQVAMAQRDLLAAQVAEIEALVSALKARVTLYRLDGSLLTRRGLQAPGAEPVELP